MYRDLETRLQRAKGIMKSTITTEIKKQTISRLKYVHDYEESIR